MRVIKKIPAFLLMLVLCIGMMSMHAFATSSTQDGLEVTLTTDKEEYSQGEEIIATITVTNTNDVAVTNVSLEGLIPDGYKLAEGTEATKQVETLGAGETVTLVVTYVQDVADETEAETVSEEETTTEKSESIKDEDDKKDNNGNGSSLKDDKSTEKENSNSDATNISTPKTGDSSDIMYWLVLIFLTCVVFIIKLGKKKNTFISLCLCVAIVGLVFSVGSPIKASANGDNIIDIEVSKTIVVDSKELEVNAIVSACISKEVNTDKENDDLNVVDYIYTPNIENIKTDTDTGISYVNNIIVIIFSETATEDEIDEVIDATDGNIVGKNDIINQYQVQISEKSLGEIRDLIEMVESYNCVLFAHYDQAYQNVESAVAPNDPWNGDVDNTDWTDTDVDGSNWWLEAIEAPAAWDYNDRFSQIKIGIVDNGFDTGHEDLTLSFPEDFERVNSKENHGTHVAGIIGATANNIGITGIVWNKELICYDWKPNWWQERLLDWETDTMIISGLIFDVEAGAKVINYSLGIAGNYPNGKVYSQDIINEQGKTTSGYMAVLLKKYDFIVVQAAGNGGVDAINAGYFASITSDNCVSWGTGRASKQNILDRILVVAAVEQSEDGYMVTEYSDGGSRVDIAAPGGNNSGRNDEDIYSCVTGGWHGKYKAMAGTSMAAPIVTGVASLVWSVDDNFTGADVKEIVCNNTSITAVDNPLSRKTTGDFQIVNAKLAVEEALRRSNNVGHGTLSGKICKASDRITPVIGASINVYKNNRIYATEIADDNGNYTINLPGGEYLIDITAEGYVAFSDYASVTENNNTYMETFLLVEGSEDESGIASGNVCNALSGSGIEGVALTIRKGWNNTAIGDIIATTTTNSDGSYMVTLPLGNYTMYATREGYISSTINIIVQEGTTSFQNGTMTPVISGDSYRIVLTWGRYPDDLDSHVEGILSNNDTFHVFFGEMSQYDGDFEVCNLDVDDITSYGPETITLNVNNSLPYYYYIHNFSGNGSIADSNAQVKVYQGENLIGTFNVPTDQGDEIYWNVFAIKNGEIIAKNTITSNADTSYALSN